MNHTGSRLICFYARLNSERFLITILEAGPLRRAGTVRHIESSIGIFSLNGVFPRQYQEIHLLNPRIQPIIPDFYEVINCNMPEVCEFFTRMKACKFLQALTGETFALKTEALPSHCNTAGVNITVVMTTIEPTAAAGILILKPRAGYTVYPAWRGVHPVIIRLHFYVKSPNYTNMTILYILYH